MENRSTQDCEPDVVRVAAGVIRDASGRILLSQRPEGKHLAGKWEFPGGKCDSEEDLRHALARELGEELGITVRHASPLLGLTHAYPETRVYLRLYEVDEFAGRVESREGQALRWAAASELQRIDMPAADRPMIKALTLDPCYAITPEPDQVGGVQGVVDLIRGALDSGVRLLQLRAPGMALHELEALARAISPHIRAGQARWLLNGPPELACSVGADGVHVSSRALEQLSGRPMPDDKLVIVSCHGQGELERAGSIGADFVCLSPVLATATHPDASPLGWEGFANLCRHSPLPVFALGGLSPEDVDRARAKGAFGVAGIRRFAR